MNSILSTMLSAHRNKKTIAYQVTHHFRDVGLLYIQQGLPVSCEYSGFTGAQAIETLYREEKTGIEFHFIELEELGIYCENIKEENFELFILNLLKKFRMNKILKKFNWHNSPEVNYWQ